jgi:hypothetical protein
MQPKKVAQKSKNLKNCIFIKPSPIFSFDLFFVGGGGGGHLGTNGSLQI